MCRSACRNARLRRHEAIQENPDAPLRSIRCPAAGQPDDGLHAHLQLAAPSEPININLNVKIEHEIYIGVDKALDGIINENSGLF